MKRSIKILAAIILLINQSCKGQSDNFKHKSIQRENIENVENNIQEVSLFKYTKWEFVDNIKAIYKADNQTIQLKNFISKSKNTAGKKLYVNNIEIDSITTDAYKLKPYLFINNDEKILLLEESAEDGIWGYILYVFRNNKLIKRDFLNIAPVDEVVEVNDFILLSKENNEVVVKLKTESYYNSEIEKVDKSDGYLHVINPEIKIEKDSYDIPSNYYVYDSVLIQTEKSTYKVLSIEKKKEKDNLAGWHFNLPIVVLKERKKGSEYYKLYENSKLVFGKDNDCPADGYIRVISKNEYFTIEQVFCSDSKFVNSYTTFRFHKNLDKIHLYKYGEQYTDRSNPEKIFPDRIWTIKDFGDVNFEEVTADFLIKLRQKSPRK
jgi:hypothetical protein